MIREAVVETFQQIVDAVANGAERIELCDNLSQGGTTPSFGMVKCAIAYCHAHHVEVAVMIRPRGGDFVYSLFDKEVMREDIQLLKTLQPDFFVVGALNASCQLDLHFLSQLKALSDVPFVMHMAFDQIENSQQLKAMDQLITLGFVRILTHGSSDGQSPILDNVKQLARLLVYSKGRIEIMPGGGLNKENLPLLLEQIPFQEVHGTKIV